MKVHDVVHGEISLPTFLEPLIWAPEFQRLQRVRLININSPTLASLADATRYSHTLGVLKLALENPFLGLDEAEVKAFLASVLIHDAATPAFAHLFEYFLKERFDWDHESAISNLLNSSAHSDGHLRQVYRSLIPRFAGACKEAGVDFRLVASFVEGHHLFSKLLFGSLDFDNLDNVLRMNVLIGEKLERAPFLRLAKNISIGRGGKLSLSEDFRPDVEVWSNARKIAYSRLVWDESTVARQAVLAQAIEHSLDNHLLNQSDWTYDDERLISVLLQHPESKSLLIQDYFGEPPRLLLLAQIRSDESKILSMRRSEITSLIRRFLRDMLPKSSHLYGYVFRDRGSFSKRLEFMGEASDRQWSVGETSRSLILYGFGKTVGASGSTVFTDDHFISWLGDVR